MAIDFHHCDDRFFPRLREDDNTTSVTIHFSILGEDKRSNGECNYFYQCDDSFFARINGVYLDGKLNTETLIILGGN